MPLTIHGMNTGVIRHNNQFIALALKIKHDKKKENLLFFPLLSLKDLLLSIEQRLHMKSLLSDSARKNFDKATESAEKKLQQNAPVMMEEELKNADVRLRVERVTLTHNAADSITLELSLNGGDTVTLLINDTQMRLLVNVIILAMNNAGLRAILDSVSSILDFLPLYDVDCKDKGQLEFDTYQHPEWKHALFNYYLTLMYLYKNEQGEEQACGTVIKTRTPSNSKEAQSIAKRLLRYSNRLRKLENIPCKVLVRTLVADKPVTLTQDQCLHAVHSLRYQSEQSAA
ncbi:YjeJ family protein [Enterobacter sp.]|uniref:YjeJ family protein n=1 Tax=Enterobacter sp. TaxID=42895 RepID=UPI00296E80B7|nr:YjeJ family protein [Enterobacter sp.]